MGLIEVYYGQLSKPLLEKLEFSEAWQDLWERCPWATVFQSPDFVLTWFDCFPDYHPTIITDWDGNSMTGVWMLTERQGRFTAPGFDFAEYQVWLSTPGNQGYFLDSAMKEFVRKFPSGSIYMKYVPSDTPMEVFEKNSFLKDRTVWRSHQQPLMVAEKALLNEELKKKNRKEKINRLNRLGKLEFSKTKDLQTFQFQIDEMALQSDFRKGALYNKTFFHDQPQRKEFLLRLFALGHLHVTTLSVADILIASNVGIMSPQMVHLQGINSHSPFYSRYSPGILHFLMLGISLADEGILLFDLTPGGVEGYKAVLANRHEIAYEWWFGSKTFAFRTRIIELLKLNLKKRLEKKPFCRIDWVGVYEKIQRLQVKVRSLTKFVGGFPVFATNFLGDIQKTQISFNDLEIANQKIHTVFLRNPNLKVKKNHIPDLFYWQEKNAGVSRKELFLDCLNRIEFGQQMFTLTDEKNLIAIFWYIASDAKIEGQEARNHSAERPPILLFSCYKFGRENEVISMAWKEFFRIPNEPQQKPTLLFSAKQKSIEMLFRCYMN